MHRNQYIDVLRFAGAFLVLMAHFWPKNNVLYKTLHFGRLGVVLFFCISGFLIGRILIQHRLNIEQGAYTRGNALLEFYSRRALRIFPLYFGVIFFFCVIGYAPITDRIVWHLTYTSNYGQIFRLDMANTAHFWSLCVEEQFYLIVPFVILWTRVAILHNALLCIFSISVVTKVFVAYYTQDWLAVTRGLHGNMEGLIVGILIAYLSMLVPASRSKKVLNWTSMFGAVALFNTPIITILS